MYHHKIHPFICTMVCISLTVAIRFTRSVSCMSTHQHISYAFFFAHYRIAQNFDSGKVWWNLTNQACMSESLTSKLWSIDCSLHRKSINRKKREGETLTNQYRSPFIKFVRLFHRQSFVLHGVYVWLHIILYIAKFSRVMPLCHLQKARIW